MNIVISHNPINNVIAGISATLQKIASKDNKIKTHIWDVKNKPVYDMMDEINPDIIFMDANQVTQTFITAIEDRPPKHLIMFGISYFQQLNPSLICLPTNIPDKIKSHIDKERLSYLEIELAANIAQYYGGSFSKKLQSDILYISNIDTQHRPDIQQCLTEIYKTDLYSLKIVGRHPVALPAYLGMTSIKNELDLMKSAKIVIDFDGSMLYNYIVNGVPCISNKTNAYYPKFEHANDIMKLVAQNCSIVDEEIQKAISTDTYFHTLGKIFYELNLDDLANITFDIINKIADGRGKYK